MSFVMPNMGMALTEVVMRPRTEVLSMPTAFPIRSKRPPQSFSRKNSMVKAPQRNTAISPMMSIPSSKVPKLSVSRPVTLRKMDRASARVRMKVSPTPMADTMRTVTRSKKSRPTAKKPDSRIRGSRFSRRERIPMPKQSPLTKQVRGTVMRPTASPFATRGRFSFGVMANPAGKANITAQPMVLPTTDPAKRPTVSSCARARASGHPPESLAISRPAMTEGSMPTAAQTGVRAGARVRAIRGAMVKGPIIARIRGPVASNPRSKDFPGPKRHPTARSAAPIRAKTSMV